MTTGIQAILQSSQNSSLCKISIGIKKSSRDYLSIILTEILTETPDCSCNYIFEGYKQKTAWKT